MRLVVRTRLARGVSVGTSVGFSVPRLLILVLLAWALFGCAADPSRGGAAPVSRWQAALWLGQATCEQLLACGTPDDGSCAQELAASTCSGGRCRGDVADPDQLEECLISMSGRACDAGWPSVCRDVLR